MEVRIDGKRFAGIPSGLAPLLQAYAGLQGRSVTRAPDGVLHVAGPLSGYRLALRLDDDSPLRSALHHTKALLEALGARVVDGAEDVAAVVGLRSGEAPAVSPGGLFRGDDRVLARCLREGLQGAQGGRRVAEVGAPAGHARQAPAGGAEALVTLPPDFPAALGLACGLLRFAGLSPAQVEALRLPDLLVALPAPESTGSRLPRRLRRTVAQATPGPSASGPEPMLLSPDGHWVSPRAHRLEQQGKR